MVQAKQQWKELKAGYQQRVEAIEGAVPCVLAQLEKGQHLAQRLKEALARYEAQRHEAEKKARDARERRQKEQSHSPLFPAPAPCADVRGTVLELQHSYSQLAPLLTEIQALQTRFPIDWQPQERRLRFLQPSAVWTLAPPQETPSLRDWLEYLSTLDI
ncbi:dynein regulatory complex protein 1 [Platysternon megacephalum]|uniref:Dynein regulatory complex protein 1 n=1 Tax=Platysternon megacephalum TaxID=55544 RepID=A0A4D9DRC3_9SAUR|nr:dynein regulatory complex protein 1 [Platysternon megacephalum]